MTNRFFEGLKVVELASVLAGPAVGLFFTELGADVIKIENATTNGDVTRSWKAPGEPPHKTDSAYYRSVNFNKKIRLLNLKDKTDQQTAIDLTQQADIVIVNYRPGQAKKLGMDYPSLSANHPRLIYAELTGYGEADSRPAFDVVLQAETGFLHLNGSSDGPPVKMPVALIDVLAAHQLKEGLLLALLQRERTGKGSKVSASLYASALSSLANQATNWLVAGFSPQRMGAQHPNIAPYGDIFHTADQQALVLAVGVESHFKQLCSLLNIPEIATDERFSHNTRRITNRQALVDALQRKIGQYDDREGFLKELQLAGIPAGAIRDIPDVFAQDSAQMQLVETTDDAGNIIQCVSSIAFRLET